MCRGVYTQLKEALALPCETKGAVQSDSKSQYLFGGGARHILPSFFNLLKHLHAQVLTWPSLSQLSMPVSLGCDLAHG